MLFVQADDGDARVGDGSSVPLPSCLFGSRILEIPPQQQHPLQWAPGCPVASCCTWEEKVNFLDHPLWANTDIQELLWIVRVVAREALAAFLKATLHDTKILVSIGGGA